MIILISILLPVVIGIALPFMKLKNRRIKCGIITTVLVATCVASILVAVQDSSSLPIWNLTDQLSIAFYADGLSKLFSVLISFVWMLTGIYSFLYMTHEKNEDRFYAFFLISLGMMMSLCYAQNIVTMYMCFEMVTLCSMPLVLHSMEKPAISAALKYLFYSIAGAFLALLGIFVIAANDGLGLFAPGGIIDINIIENRNLFLAAIFVAVVGFGAKAGMYPLHGWLPAAHPVAPSPASAVLSALIAKAGVLAIIRVIFYTVGTEILAGTWVQYVWITLALITVFMGSMMAYREKHLKKRLAFSTVSQISYVLLGLFIFTAEGAQGGLLQVVFHAFAKTVLFMVAGAIIFHTGKTQVDDLRGIGRQMPVTMWCFIIAALTLIGIPPTGGFASKWHIATSALQTDLGVFSWLVPVVLLISALLTAGYLLPVVIDAFFPGGGRKTEVKRIEKPSMYIPMIVLAALCVGLGLISGGLESYISQITQMLV